MHISLEIIFFLKKKGWQWDARKNVRLWFKIDDDGTFCVMRNMQEAYNYERKNKCPNPS